MPFTFDLDEAPDDNRGRMCRNPSVLDEASAKENLDRALAQNARNLSLADNDAFPYDNRVRPVGRPLPAGEEAPGLPANPDPVPDRAPEGLSKAELVEVFKQAYPIAAQGKWADMPDWSSNTALDGLVFHESGRKPHAKNKDSSAFGLFQFLDSTWRDYGIPKTSDPVMQAAAGMRYVRSRYRTPERALAFQRSTSTRNPDIAPADLRSQAIYWMSKGWKGY